MAQNGSIDFTTVLVLLPERGPPPLLLIQINVASFVVHQTPLLCGVCSNDHCLDSDNEQNDRMTSKRFMIVCLLPTSFRPTELKSDTTTETTDTMALVTPTRCLVASYLLLSSLFSR